MDAPSICKCNVNVNVNVNFNVNVEETSSHYINIFKALKGWLPNAKLKKI